MKLFLKLSLFIVFLNVTLTTDVFEGMSEEQMAECWHRVFCVKKNFPIPKIKEMLQSGGEEFFSNVMKWFSEISKLTDPADNEEFWMRYPVEQCSYERPVFDQMFYDWMVVIGEYWAAVCESNDDDCEKINELTEKLREQVAVLIADGTCTLDKTDKIAEKAEAVSGDKMPSFG